MRKFLFVLLMPVLAACAVEQMDTKGAEITIEHPASQFGIAELKADGFCRDKGMITRHVQTTPRSASVLFFQTSLSTFECLIPKPKT